VESSWVDDKKMRISMNRDIDADETGKSSQADLAEGYRQMAADMEREAEAEEWAEALIGDVLEIDPAIASDSNEVYEFYPVG
jgi:hypothetical protein